MKKIYLAGGWSPWRGAVISVVSNCIWLDPRDAQDPTTGKNLPNWFEMELEMLKECDAVIAYIALDNNSGYGTTFEVSFAYALNKPYIFINEKDDVYKWSMQTKGSFADFKSIDEALQWIKRTGWMGMDVEDYIHYKEGIPCTHHGCWAHKTHPCECCGRIACEGDAFIKKTKKDKICLMKK